MADVLFRISLNKNSTLFRISLNKNSTLFRISLNRNYLDCFVIWDCCIYICTMIHDPIYLRNKEMLKKLQSQGVKNGHFIENLKQTITQYENYRNTVEPRTHRELSRNFKPSRARNV